MNWFLLFLCNIYLFSVDYIFILSHIHSETIVPTIVGPNTILVTVGQTSTINLSYNNTPTRVKFTSESTLPGGATINDNTGEFSWAVADYITQPIDLVWVFICRIFNLYDIALTHIIIGNTLFAFTRNLYKRFSYGMVPRKIINYT